MKVFLLKFFSLEFLKSNFANLLSMYAIYLGIKNSRQYRDNSEVLVNDRIYKVESIEYLNQDTGKIEKQFCNGIGVYHFGCNVHNYSSSSLHIHNLGLTDQSNKEIPQYANSSIAIQSPTNIIVNYQNQSLGQSTFLFYNKSTRDMSAKSTLQIDMLFHIPSEVNNVTFRIPIAITTKISNFYNNKLIKKILKKTKINTRTQYKNAIGIYNVSTNEKI